LPGIGYGVIDKSADQVSAARTAIGFGAYLLELRRSLLGFGDGLDLANPCLPGGEPCR
jgi:hypothetical protein